MIPFNKPFLTGKEAHYIYQAVYTGQLSGNGIFTKKCQDFFESLGRNESILSDCYNRDFCGILLTITS